MNQANGQLRFYFSGDFPYLLAGQDSGYMVRCTFRTRDNNATNANANITLASSWFSYLFEDAQLRLAGSTIEHTRHLGVVTDVFYHMENAEVRYQTGSLVGFIPDTSFEVSDSIGRRIGDIASNDVNAIVPNVNHANQRNVQANENYNEIFIKRRKLYNYTVVANDDFRELDMFIPLNRIFSFCDKVNRLLKYIPFEIVLTKSAANSHCVYGAANTAIDFPNHDSGIQSIKLHLERIKLRPDLASEIEKLYRNPFNIAYYKHICETSATQAGTQKTFGHTKTFTADDEGSPRFVFIIIKNHANNTPQLNYQRCCHANISNITVGYAGFTYPLLMQGADFNRNQYFRFYKKIIKVSKSLGNSAPALSMQEFRDLYTIF